MIDHAVSYVDYCQEVLVPVWERWGTPRAALREALACGEAGHPSSLRRQRLLAAVETILRLSDDPGLIAAACAGMAGLCALQGDPDRRFWEVTEQALARDREALARPAHA